MTRLKDFQVALRDTSSMDYTLAKLLDSAFTSFIRYHQAYPDELQEREWRDILVEIRDGFRTYWRYQEFEWNESDDVVTFDEADRALKRSLDLMKEWWHYLWW